MEAHPHNTADGMSFRPGEMPVHSRHVMTGYLDHNSVHKSKAHWLSLHPIGYYKPGLNLLSRTENLCLLRKCLGGDEPTREFHRQKIPTQLPITTPRPEHMARRMVLRCSYGVRTFMAPFDGSVMKTRARTNQGLRGGSGGTMEAVVHQHKRRTGRSESAPTPAARPPPPPSPRPAPDPHQRWARRGPPASPRHPPRCRCCSWSLHQRKETHLVNHPSAGRCT